MKKVLLLLLTFNLQFLTFNSFSQTSVPGGSVSGTWTLAGSPYNVQGSISVSNGSTLTIQPGVTVNFQGHYKLNVQGRLLAIGTLADSIIFTASNTSTGWGGVRFDHTPITNDTSKIYYCSIRYGKANGSGNDSYGGGILLYTYSKVIINHCGISNNIASSDGAGICCFDNSSPVIWNNVISYNSGAYWGGGIRCFGSNPSIFYNTISNNSATRGGGIYFGGSSSPIVSNNIISNNLGTQGGGVHCFNYSSPTFINNIISNNSATNGGGLFLSDDANPTFINSILSGNAASASGTQVFFDAEGSDPNFYYCDVQGGPDGFDLNGYSYTGTYQNNINSNPLFVLPSDGSGNGFNGAIANWSLQNNSPCINTGDPNGTYPATDKAGNSRVTVCKIDMGAYEFQNGIPLTATVSQGQQILCYGDSTATATIVAAGGSGSYTYVWNTAPFGTNATGTFLGGGTSSVTVTETSYGCSVTKTIVIGQPPHLTFTTTPSDVLCKNGNTGSITVNASGGTSALQYSKNGGSTYQSSNIFAGLTASSYQIVVKDANNCIAPTQNVTINEPTLLSFTKTSSDVLCKNGNSGSITVTGVGGTPTLQYSKDNGSTFQSSAIFSGLITNTYQVLVKDANNCVTSDQSVIINEPTLLAFTTAQGNVLCNNGNSGSITVNATGGTPTLQYSKDGGSTYQSSNIFTGLVANTYLIAVKDANNCVAPTQIVIITEPTFLAFTTTPVNLNCYGDNSGSIAVSANGGSGTFQYSKDNGSTYQVSSFFNGLSAAFYQIIVKDANNCVAPMQGLLISEPTLLSFTKTSSNELCNNSTSGSIVVIANGGNGIKQYSKDGGSFYQFANSFNGLTANIYHVVVKDANNCIAPMQSDTITQPPAIIFSTVDTNVSCYSGSNGSITLTASGGTGTLQYSKNNNINFQTSPVFSSLISGIYSITVKDVNNCVSAAHADTVTQPNALLLFPTHTDVKCSGLSNGSAATNASGGTIPYTFLWSSTPTQSADTARNLSIGTYTVSVTDTHSCLTSATVTIAQPVVLSLIQIKKNASCNNNDGRDSIIPNGGTAPYSYLWSNGSHNQNLTGLGSGTYFVALSDHNGCAIADTLIINNSLAPGSIPICMVTVDSSSTKNVIVWEKPNNAPIDSFRIYREIASVYSHIGTVAYSALSEFTDNSIGINPNTTSYKYKLSVLDTCGNESPLSADHQTVHVQLGVAFPSGVNLSWNDYVGFTFSQYRILRDDLGNGSWHVLDSVSYGITTYTSTDVLPNARYIVEAKRQTPCVSTRQSIRSSSKSNTASQTTGVDELANELSVMIYPNPSNGKFIISFSQPELVSGSLMLKQVQHDLSIYNVLGECIYLSKLKYQTINEIDLSEAPKGFYFVKICSSDKIYTGRIAKQ